MSSKIWSKVAQVGLILSLVAPVLQAAPFGTSTLARDFATCQGRYAAQADYDRVMGRDVADVVARAAQFDELLAAIVPAGSEAEHAIRTSRKGAAGAHWTLLHSADFSKDSRLARHALNTARRNIAMCEMLVLG